MSDIPIFVDFDKHKKFAFAKRLLHIVLFSNQDRGNNGGGEDGGIVNENVKDNYYYDDDADDNDNDGDQRDDMRDDADVMIRILIMT